MNLKEIHPALVKEAREVLEISAAELARRIKSTPANVHQWEKGLRPVPIDMCSRLDKETNGVVSRQRFRPDDWYVIWPELAEAA